MPRARTSWFAVALVASLLVLCLLPVALAKARATGRTTATAEVPSFNGDAFTRTWGAGDVELAGYDLAVPTYPTTRPLGGPATTQPLRRGTAVTVFAVETFSNELRVKADPGRHPPKDEFPVMKLNLIESFPGGAGDHHLMTSAFVSLKGVNGRPAGSPTKLAFSAQEWVGQTCEQLLFDADSIRAARHSYFDDEADRTARLDYPEKSVTEDALLLWARGFAWPLLKPGESRELPILRSLRDARLNRRPPAWARARLARAGAPRAVTVPAGTFDADVYTCQIQGDAGATWTFYVEAAEPRRILQWHRDDGYDGKLLGSDRTRYAQMTAAEYAKEVTRLGLRPREERMP